MNDRQTRRCRRCWALALLLLVACPSADDDDTTPEDHSGPSEMQYLGNAGRTGEYPGPGPSGGFGDEPVLEAWTHDLGESAEAPAIANGLLTATAQDGRSTGLDVESGVVLWEQTTSKYSPCYEHAPAATSSQVFTSCQGGDALGPLFAFDGSSGETLWEFDPGAGTSFPALTGGTVLVESILGIHVVDPDDGAEMRTIEAFDGIDFYTAWYDTFFAAEWPTLVVAGAPPWKRGSTRIFDLTDGNLLAEWPEPPGELDLFWRTSPPPILVDGKVVLLYMEAWEHDYESTGKRRLAVIDAESTSGYPAWSIEGWTVGAGGGGGSGSVAVAEGVVVTAEFKVYDLPHDGEGLTAVSAFSLDDGSLLWSHWNNWGAGKRVTIADGVAYLPGWRQEIGAFDLHTGDEIGLFPLDANVAAPPVAVGGRLYVVDGDGILHAFE